MMSFRSQKITTIYELPQKVFPSFDTFQFLASNKTSLAISKKRRAVAQVEEAVHKTISFQSPPIFFQFPGVSIAVADDAHLYLSFTKRFSRVL